MNLPAIPVRVGKVSDAAILREIRCESLLDSPSAYGARYEDVVTQPLSYWKSLIRRRRYFLACAQNSAVGMVCVDRYEYEGSTFPGVFSMYVQPHHRGVGVADDLIDACKNFVRDGGQRVLYLDVVEDNDRAFAFYCRQGFAALGPMRPMASDASRQMITMVCYL